MIYENLYKEFVSLFIEDKEEIKRLEEEAGVTDEDGMHILFGMVVTPFVLYLVEKKEDSKLKIAFDYFEKMDSSDNNLISEVAEFTVLENLISSDKDKYNYCKRFMGSETKKSCEQVSKYFL